VQGCKYELKSTFTTQVTVETLIATEPYLPKTIET